MQSRRRSVPSPLTTHGMGTLDDPIPSCPRAPELARGDTASRCWGSVARAHCVDGRQPPLLGSRSVARPPLLVDGPRAGAREGRRACGAEAALMGPGRADADAPLSTEEPNGSYVNKHKQT